MPKSKREKKISLTRTQKKVGLEFKQALVDKVRSAVDNYARIFVFKPENQRNATMKDVRGKWSHSKFFIGKNRVIAKALGNTPEEEYSENLHKVSMLMRGEVGLLCTNEKTEDVIEFFDNLSAADYARTGAKCTETVVIPAGPVEQFSHDIEPHLRSLGLPTKLEKGIVTLYQEHTVCEEGDILSSQQARILKLFGKQQAEFRLQMLAVWSNDGEFKILAELPEIMNTPKKPKKDEKEEKDDNEDDDEDGAESDGSQE